MEGGGVGGVGVLEGEEVVGTDGVIKPATLSRPLVRTLPLSEVVGVAPWRMASLTCAAVAEGFRALYSAAAPATCGVAIDVPEYVPYPPVPGSVE